MNSKSSFITPRVESRCVVLDRGLTVTDVADAARSAALGFAWGANNGWGKRELARWLEGPYARAVAVSHGARAGVRRRVAPRPISEETIETLLARAHAFLMDGLRSVSEWRRDASFAREMIDEGFVVGVVDESSAIGYAPLDAYDMRLVDRVRSLFVADFLSRPDDYEDFIICDACGAATFEGAQFHELTCGEALTPSVPSLRKKPVFELLRVAEEEGSSFCAETVTPVLPSVRHRPVLELALPRIEYEEDEDDDDTVIMRTPITLVGIGAAAG